MAAPVTEAQVKLTLLDRVTAGVKRIQASFVALGRRIGLDRISAQARNLGNRLRGVSEGANLASGRLARLTAILGLGGGGVVAATMALVRETSTLGGELDAMSKRAGVSAEALQELKYAAATRGVGFDALVDGFKELNLRADEFIATGKGSAADAFKRLGYSAAGLKSKLNDPAALFGEMLERLSKLDAATQIRFTDELFGGTGGEQFMQMVGMTADELAALRIEARKTGSILGDDVVAATSNLNTQFDGLNARFRGMRLRIGAGLIPVMSDAVKTMTDWVDANRDLIRTRIEYVIQWITSAVRDLMNPASELRKSIDGWVESFRAFYDRAAPVVDFLGGPMKVAIFTLAAYIFGPLVLALTMAAGAVVKLGLAIMATPVGWILGGIALMAASVYVLIQKWDEFVAYWDGIWQGVVDAFDRGFIEGVLALLSAFNPLPHIVRGIDAVIEYFTGISLVEQGEKLMASIGEGIKSGWDSIAEWLGEKFTALWDNTFGRIPGISWFTDDSGSEPASEPETSNRSGRNRRRGGGAAPVAAIPPVGVPPVPVAVPTLPGAGGDVQAGEISAQNITIPEPLVVREPQKIDASVTIQSLTVNGGTGSPAEVGAAVRAELARHAASQRAALGSGLND